MEPWRKYFQSSGADLWIICERALTVAYMEDPGNFPVRRDKLAQKLFAPEKLDSEASEKETFPSMTKWACSLDLHKANDWIAVVDGTYDGAEALTKEMEEEILVKRSVLGIKDSLEGSFQSEKEVLATLHRLDLMQLSVDVLQDTEIGKTVNMLRKNPSKRVSAMAKQLVRGWKDLAEEWLKSAKDVAAAATSETPISASPSDINEEHGLPSPPMDEGALLTTSTGCVEISQLFDFMNCDNSADSDSLNCYEDDCLCPSWTDHKKPCDVSCNMLGSQSVNKQSKCLENSAARDTSSWKDLEKQSAKEWKAVANLNDHLDKAAHSNKNTCNGINVRANISTNESSLTGGMVKSVGSSHNQLIKVLKSGHTLHQCKDDVGYNEKIEATKRKLQKNYQKAENVKKQRTTRVMDLQDLPKGGPNRARPSYQASSRPGSQRRPWIAGHK